MDPDTEIKNSALMFMVMSSEEKFFALKKTYPKAILPIPTSSIINKKDTDQDKSYYTLLYGGQASFFYKHDDFAYDQPCINIKINKQADLAIMKLFYSVIPFELLEKLKLNINDDKQPDSMFFLLVMCNYISFKQYYHNHYSLKTPIYNPVFMKNSTASTFSNFHFKEFELGLETQFKKKILRDDQSLAKRLTETNDFLINIVKRLCDIPINISKNAKRMLDASEIEENRTDNQSSFTVEINNFKSFEYSLAFSNFELKNLNRLSDVLNLENKIRKTYKRINNFYKKLISLCKHTDTFKIFIFYFTEYFYLFSLLNGLHQKSKK